MEAGNESWSPNLPDQIRDPTAFFIAFRHNDLYLRLLAIPIA